jgi:RHS repeat-associated protein
VANNQLTNWNGQPYAYDLNGNLTSDGSKTLTWDTRDQLSALSGAATAIFQYDGFGRRAAKTINGINTGFVYDGLNLVRELAGGAPKADLLTGLRIDEVFARTQSAVTSSFLTDALGSTVSLTDGNGARTTNYTYEPYGAATQAGAPNENAQRFTGREDDRLLVYFRSRYYLPPCGRFISEPIEAIGHRYIYADSSPMNLVDPLGLWSLHVGIGDGRGCGTTAVAMGSHSGP